MDQTPFAQGFFPISLWTTTRLIGALIYLQILYGIAYLRRPFSSSHREFPPLNKNIDEIEKVISNIILDLVPLTAYSSATATERQWRLSSGNGTLNHTDPMMIVPPCPEPSFTKPWSPMGRQNLDSSDNVQSDNLNKALTRSSTIHRTGSSIYDAVQNIKSSTRESMSSLASSAKAIFHQPGSSKPLLVVPRNLNHSPLDGTYDELRPKPWEEFAQPLPIQQRAARNDLSSMPAPISAAARLADHFSDPGPSSRLKTEKTPEILTNRLADGAVKHSETVQMNRARKYNSIESYPGKFPVSDSLEYSSLATAFANVVRS
ncbi:unnamed protein product [Penicillium bialowiezense]